MTRKRKPPAPPVFTDEQRQPWDRLPKEGDKAWACFCTYRDAPHRPAAQGGPQPRSQRHVSAVQYPYASPSAGRVAEIGGWSRKFNWVERCNAYDAHLDRQRQEAFAAALKADMETNIAAYRQMRNKGARALVVADPAGIAPQHAARMVDTAITGLRREAGMATEIQGNEKQSAFVEWLTQGNNDDEDEVPSGRAADDKD